MDTSRRDLPDRSNQAPNVAGMTTPEEMVSRAIGRTGHRMRPSSLAPLIVNPFSLKDLWRAGMIISIFNVGHKSRESRVL